MIEAPDMDMRHRSLNLAFRGLNSMPEEYVERGKGMKLRELDLSNNKVSDMRFLMETPNLETLILDKNNIESHIKFPPVSMLTTLWVNHNKITNLAVFINNVSHAFPELHYLSMMNNEAAPSYFNGGTYSQYRDYRHYVISQLPELRALDYTPVTPEERYEAERIYHKHLPASEPVKRKKSSVRAKRQSSMAEADQHMVDDRGRQMGHKEPDNYVTLPKPASKTEPHNYVIAPKPEVPAKPVVPPKPVVPVKPPLSPTRRDAPPRSPTSPTRKDLSPSRWQKVMIVKDRSPIRKDRSPTREGKRSPVRDEKRPTQPENIESKKSEVTERTDEGQPILSSSVKLPSNLECLPDPEHHPLPGEDQDHPANLHSNDSNHGSGSHGSGNHGNGSHGSSEEVHVTESVEECMTVMVLPQLNDAILGRKKDANGHALVSTGKPQTLPKPAVPTKPQVQPVS